MDPVLLSKVPLAPVSVRALWVTCAATETGTDPLRCLYSTKKVCNLKHEGAMPHLSVRDDISHTHNKSGRNSLWFQEK